MIARVGVFALVIGAGLTGCQTVSAPFDLGKQSVPASDSWAATGPARAGVDSQWVDRFGDARLTQLVEVALASNNDLKGSAARVERAATALRVSRSALLPDVTANVTGQRRQAAFAGLPFGGGGVATSIDNLYGTSLDVSWELDLWGRIRAGNQAVLADLQSEGLTYRAARASLIGQVAKAYFTAIEAEEQLQLARTALDITKETETAIRERFESALGDEGGTASQLRLTQTDVASAKATLAERKGQAAQTKRQLEILLGQYPKGQLAVRKSLPALGRTPPAGLPSELLLRRPDILAAERQYAGSKSRIREAKLARFPQLKLTGSVGSSTTELRNILNSDFGQWSMGANVVQTILINGRLTAEIDARKIAKNEASYALQQTVLEAFGEVEEALANEKVLRERELALREAVTTASEATVSSREDYAGGSGDIVTLLTAQSREIQIASQLSAIRRARWINRIDLHLALGGDYKVRSK